MGTSPQTDNLIQTDNANCQALALYINSRNRTITREALVDDHVSVEDCPELIDVGLAVMLAVDGITITSIVTEADEFVAGPPVLPIQFIV